MRRLNLMWLLLLLWPATVQGEAAQTLAFRDVIRIEPAAWHLGIIGGLYKDVVSRSGYRYTEYLFPTKPTQPLNFLPVLEQLLWDGDYGSWLFITHGDLNAWLTMEPYGNDQDGYNVRETAWYSYKDVYTGQIAKVDVVDETTGQVIAYGIGVNPLFFSSRWYDPGSPVLVDLRACYSWNMRSGFPGATFCGYDDWVYVVSGSQAGINSMYMSLGGVSPDGNDVRGRVLRNATFGQLSSWHITGDLDVTLCPAVVTQIPTKAELYDGLDERVTVQVTFDTKIAWPPDGTNIIYATDAAYIYNVEAINDTTLLFALTGTQKSAWGTVGILSGSYETFWCGIYGYPAYTGLDGNGIYPNGDNYTFDVYSLLGDNPAAMVGGLTVTRDPDGPLARWVVESELNTARYLVQRADDPLSTYVTVAEVEATGTTFYQCRLPMDSEGFYRLEEVETDGDTLKLAYARIDDLQPIEPDSVVASTLAIMPDGLTSAAETQTLGYYTDVIYTPVAFVLAANILASFQNSIAIPSVVVTLESLKGGAAEVKADFAARVSNGARNMLKLGDANDDHDARGFQVWNNPICWDSLYVRPDDTCTPQPENNLFPVAQYNMVWGFQPLQMTYWEKVYANDWADIDRDGDGLPDPGLSVGRLPATNIVEAVNAVNKTIHAYQFNSTLPHAKDVFVFAYAFDVGGDSTGAAAKAYADSVVTYLPEEYTVNRFTDEPEHSYTNAERDALCVAQFNAGGALHVYKSSVNGRYHNAGCLDQNRYASLAGLTTNPYRLPFLYVSSCGGADFDRTEIDLIGRPLNERLLENRDDLGCWGYFGPTRGIWQYGQHLMDKEFLGNQLFGIGAPSVGQAAARAVYALATKYPHLRDLALSHAFIGAPSVRLAGMTINTTGTDDQPQQSPLALAPPAPNPSRGSTTIRFSLPTPAHVDISVYDVMGRRVRTVMSGALTAGQHTQATRMDLATGEYFVRLVAGEHTRVQKMVITH